MTRKDYIALAAALNAEIEAAYQDETRNGETAARTLCNVTVRLADVLSADNPNFDRHRFYSAALAGQVRATLGRLQGRFELL